MSETFQKYKGIHPGLVLELELKKRKLQRGRFAKSVGEFPQTLGAIIKGKRRMNIPLALKIDQKLGMPEGFFAIIQTWYDIESEKSKPNDKTPDLSLIRDVVFWDTDIKKINWQKHKNAIIKRVFERGNQTEKDEITRFYGAGQINEIIEKFGLAY
jgi:plasmid maintenance system antidote protein VapI